ncbi:MAG: helix-turn-helix domain-containing protein [Pseudomonadota bacterium]
MARPRAFDIDTALDAAMNVFWRKGYEGASLNDLLDAMQIARGSLYKAFADKRSIYLAALDHYDRTIVGPGIAMLGDPRHGDGIVRVKRLLNASADALAQQGDRRGCFICNAAVDRAPHDHEVEAKVKAMLGRIEDGIDLALADAEATRRWPSQQRRAAARALTTSYMGLRVMAKAGYDARGLREIINTTLASLELLPA